MIFVGLARWIAQAASSPCSHVSFQVRQRALDEISKNQGETQTVDSPNFIGDTPAIRNKWDRDDQGHTLINTGHGDGRWAEPVLAPRITCNVLTAQRIWNRSSMAQVVC